MYTSTPQYMFIVKCLIYHKDNFTVTCNSEKKYSATICTFLSLDVDLLENLSARKEIKYTDVENMCLDWTT
jgi:hypothetical protein